MDSDSGDSSIVDDPSYDASVSPMLPRSQTSKNRSRKRRLQNRNNDKAARNDLMEEHENASQDVISNNSIKKPKEIKEREKKSIIWNHFSFIGDRKDQIVRCKHCGQTYCYSSSTSNMQRHMKSRHQNIYHTDYTKEQSSCNKVFA